MRVILRTFLLLLGAIALFATSAHAQGEFLYLNRNFGGGPNAVNALSIAADGSLTEIAGSPFPTGGRGTRGGTRQGVVINGTFLFASNVCTSDVSAFTINPMTGSLALVSGSPFSTRGTFNCVADGISLAITPSGQFLMAGNTGDGTVSVFKVGPSGALTHVKGSPFQTVGEPLDMKVTPDNNFLVIASGIFGGIEVYKISSQGFLTAVSGSPFLRDGLRVPVTLDIRCDGKILVEGSFGFGKVIDALDISPIGELTPIAGSPVVMPITGAPGLGRFTFDEKFFFANTQDFAPVLVFSVAPGGLPTLVPGGGANLLMDYSLSVATNRSSNTAYFGIFSGNVILSAHIASNGVLTPAGEALPITTEAGGVPALAVFPAKVCGPTFDFCMQDDSNGNRLQVNLTTGAYQFTNCSGLTISGVASIAARGCNLTLQVNGPDRRLLVRIDTCARTGTASIQVLSQGASFTIVDRNTANNTCFCANGS